MASSRFFTASDRKIEEGMFLLRLAMDICHANIPDSPPANVLESTAAQSYERLPVIHEQALRKRRDDEPSAILYLHEVETHQALAELSRIDPFAAANLKTKHEKTFQKAKSMRDCGTPDDHAG